MVTLVHPLAPRAWVRGDGEGFPPPPPLARSTPRIIEGLCLSFLLSLPYILPRRLCAETGKGGVGYMYVVCLLSSSLSAKPERSVTTLLHTHVEPFIPSCKKGVLSPSFPVASGRQAVSVAQKKLCSVTFFSLSVRITTKKSRFLARTVLCCTYVRSYTRFLYGDLFRLERREEEEERGGRCSEASFLSTREKKQKNGRRGERK